MLIFYLQKLAATPLPGRRPSVAVPHRPSIGVFGVVALVIICGRVKSGAEVAYKAARQDHNHRYKPQLTCDAGKLYVRLLKARCKMQAGIFRGNQTGKKMHDDEDRENPEESRENHACCEGKRFMRAFCAYEYPWRWWYFRSALISNDRRDRELKRANHWFPYFWYSWQWNALGTMRMDEEEVARNLRLAEPWCQIEREHNLEVAFGDGLVWVLDNAKKGD